MHISDLQHQAAEWRAVNFPNYTADEQLIGAMEELGELCHAYLKLKQGIRGMDRATFRHKAEDAVGDVLIYLTGFCTATGLDMDHATRSAWDEVRHRDWIEDPISGGA